MYSRNENIVNAHSLAVHDLDQMSAAQFQNDHIIPEKSPGGHIQKIDTKHLSTNSKHALQLFLNEYQDIFSKHKHHIGNFPHFQASAIMDPSVSCKQRQRTRILPPSAMLDLNAYKKSNVFIDSIGGSDRYCSNITLTKRPTAKESKFTTKADKNLEKN